MPVADMSDSLAASRLATEQRIRVAIEVVGEDAYRPGRAGKFLHHALASEYFIQRVIAESKGVGYPAINASDLINIVVAYPRSLTEQDEILEHIERETPKFDTLIAKFRRELELLASLTQQKPRDDA